MQPTLTFSFPWNISAADAINAVAAHFGATVSINGSAPQVPEHIKRAVERIGADNPENGIETSPSIAFGSLMNGAAGNGQPASPPSAPSDAVAGSPSNVQTAPTPTTITSGNTSSVEFDSTGLAWDERIHSGNKTKTDKGEWRAKKGTDKSLIKAVELELRAKYPNGASATNGSVPNNAVGSVAFAEPSAAEFADQQAKKRAAIEHANTEAMRVAGPSPIDEKTLSALLSGKGATLTPAQNEWYAVYFAKRNAAYAEFMARPTAPVADAASAGTVTSVSAAPAPTTNVPASVIPSMLGELDSTGLPWDHRIHVGARLKDASGAWLQRHDVSAEIKAAVCSELLAAVAEQSGNVAAQASTAPSGDAGSAPVAPPPMIAPIKPEEASTDFTKLTMWIVANQVAKRISTTAAADVAKELGFAGADGNGQLVLMREQAAYWPYVVQLLQAQGAV